MRLIDIDKVVSDYKGKNKSLQNVTWFELTDYEVKAIPIKWIKNYASHKASKDLIDCYWHFWEDDVLKMVADWEKENEAD